MVEDLFLVTSPSVAEVRYADLDITLNTFDIEMWTRDSNTLKEVTHSDECMESSRCLDDVDDTRDNSL